MRIIDEFDIIEEIGEKEFISAILFNIDNDTLQYLLEDIASEYDINGQVMTNNDKLEMEEERRNKYKRIK